MFIKLYEACVHDTILRGVHKTYRGVFIKQYRGVFIKLYEACVYDTILRCVH